MFNPFGGGGGGAAIGNTFTKQEIIDLLKLELDVADYQKDQIIFKQEVDKQVEDKINQEIIDRGSTKEEDDELMDELFGPSSPDNTPSDPSVVSNYFTKQEVIDLLEKELDVADYQEDRKVFKEEVNEQVKEEVAGRTSTKEEVDGLMEELFG